MASTYDRAGKNWARGMLFEGLPALGSVLTMPSSEALCVQHLRDGGMIHADTRQTWLEYDPDIAAGLAQLAYEQHATVLNMPLEAHRPHMGYDLINADTMRSFGPQQAMAFEERLGASVNPGGHIVLWVTEWARNPAINDFRNWIEQQPEIIDARTEIDAVIAEVPGMDEWSDGARESLSLAVAMFSLAMHRYDFTEPMGLVRYADGMPMIAMRFSGIVERDPADASLTPFSSIYARYLAQMVPPMTQEDRATIERIFNLSNGTHRIEREGEMWKLISPTGKTIMERSSLSTIAKYYG